MKHNTIQTILACGSASIVAALSANGALVSYTAGDLLMGFRATGGVGFGTTYVVNIGQAAQYRDITTYGTVPIAGDFAKDLGELYGSNWASRSDLLWGIAGSPSNTATVGSDPAATMYASKAQTTPGVPGPGWAISGSATRAGISTLMVTAQGGFASYQASSDSAVAAIQADGDPNDWRSFMASGGDATRTTGNMDFGAFTNLEGTVGQQLSLFRVNGPSAGTFEGTFSVNSAGLNFVPEPTSSALAALGALALVLRRRRCA